MKFLSNSLLICFSFPQRCCATSNDALHEWTNSSTSTTSSWVSTIGARSRVTRSTWSSSISMVPSVLWVYPTMEIWRTLKNFQWSSPAMTFLLLWSCTNRQFVSLNSLFFSCFLNQKYLNNLLNRDAEVDSINNTIRNLNQLNNNNSIDLNQLNKYGTGPAAQTIDMRQQDVDISDIIITGSQPTRLTQRDVSFVSLDGFLDLHDLQIASLV